MALQNIDFGDEKLFKGMPASDFAHRIVKKYLRIAFLDQANVKADVTPEFVHHMRVSLRKALSAMKVFKNYLDPKLKEHEKFLGELIFALGRVRDLDVEIALLKSKEGTSAISKEYDRKELMNYLKTSRNYAKTNLLLVFHHEKYHNLISSLSAFFREGAGVPGQETIDEVYKNIVNKLAHKFQKLGSDLEKKSKAKSFHRLRILGKKLRYTLEFFATLYLEMAKMIEDMKRVQDDLGLINDSRVAKKRLRTMTTKDQSQFTPELLKSIKALSKHFSKKEKQGRKNFLAEYQGLDWNKLIQSL
jgi:CHAD domain-containing protein